MNKHEDLDIAILTALLNCKYITWDASVILLFIEILYVRYVTENMQLEYLVILCILFKLKIHQYLNKNVGYIQVSGILWHQCNFGG